MHEYDIPCSEKDYFWAKRGREITEDLLLQLLYSLNPIECARLVSKYNEYCRQYENDRCDYTEGELIDMYCGPFNIRPECFSVEAMYIQ